jgi:carbonic anhydrase
MKCCPLCGLMLEPRTLEDRAFDICTSCGGVWLDAALSLRVREGDRDWLRDANDLVVAPASSDLLTAQGVQTCPTCRTAFLSPCSEKWPEGLTPSVCTRCCGSWIPDWMLPPGRVASTADETVPAPPAADTAVLQPVHVTASSERTPEKTSPADAVGDVPGSEDVTEPEDALERLLAGIRRFREGRSRHPRVDAVHRRSVLEAQDPWAVVVTCSDSRVSPELVFDQGIGDLYVVRSAACVLGEVSLATIEYALARMKPRLVLVMAHSGCGAVRAAVEGRTSPVRLARLCEALAPAVAAAREGAGNLVDSAASEQALATRRLLLSTVSGLREAADAGRVIVAAGLYRLDSAVFELLSEPEAAAEQAGVSHPVLPEVPLEQNWCPRCCRPLGPLTVCNVCGVETVPESATILCPVCTTANSFRAETCRVCFAQLRSEEMLDRVYPVPDLEGLGAGQSRPSSPSAALAMQEGGMMWCPICQAPSVGDGSLCEECGGALVPHDAHIPCERCGALNRADSRRCSVCRAVNRRRRSSDLRFMPPAAPPVKINSGQKGCTPLLLIAWGVMLLVAALAMGNGR